MRKVNRWTNILLYAKDWGVSLTIKHYFLGLKHSLISEARLKIMRDKLIEQKINLVKSLFLEDINDLNRKYQKKESSVRNDVVWQYWDQIHKPELIEMCVASVVKNSNQKCLELNDKILKKWYIPTITIKSKKDKGLITKTHFSDIIRVNLLYNYGGCWLDSTLFLTSNIDFIFDNEFWTIKIGNDDSPIKGNWAGFSLATRQGNKLMYYLTNLFELYWERYDTMIDYFLIDIFIYILYSRDPDIKAMIDNVPQNNIHCIKLEEEINKHYQEIPIEFNDTTLFKLNWKKPKIKEDGKGTTLYGRLIKQYFSE
ncbi:capsular polysaccharide synthesis protein [Holdemania massiliensis]|uniref:capsular polysaccharide synthesis protein n=1 Tax=Holdemania massiliensis TaxID=1468449 RepID=UPI00356209FA